MVRVYLVDLSVPWGEPAQSFRSERSSKTMMYMRDYGTG